MNWNQQDIGAHKPYFAAPDCSGLFRIAGLKYAVPSNKGSKSAKSCTFRCNFSESFIKVSSKWDGVALFWADVAAAFDLYFENILASGGVFGAVDFSSTQPFRGRGAPL